nr:M23 family metallopeptidase [Arthrobacter sp. UM1]
MDASAPAQWWNYWGGNGAKGTYYGTGKQANAYLNVLFSTGSKEQAQAAADKLSPAQTPPSQTAPSQTGGGQTAPSNAGDTNTNRNYTYTVGQSAATGAYGVATPSLMQQTRLARPIATDNITSWYGPRCFPGLPSCDNHSGIDFAGPDGASIQAAQSGRVIFAGWHAYGGGYRVEIDHGNGVVTTYNHLSRIDVQVGQYVTQGQHIAAEGTTGNSTGPHLHFEVIVNGAWTNPAPWLGYTAA